MSVFSFALDTVMQTLGETVIYNGDGALGLSIEAVFTNTFSMLDISTQVKVQSENPHLLVRLSDLPEDLGKGKFFEVRSKEYVVKNIEIDGEGGAKVYLYEQ